MINRILKTEAAVVAFGNWLNNQPMPESGWYVEAIPAEQKRSADQNNLLWVSAYRPIAQFLSEQSGKVITAEMVHEVAKDRFSPRIVVELYGKSKSYPKSTTRMGKAEFSDYLEQVYAWGAEMGVAFEQVSQISTRPGMHPC